jgi:hypothetical protein
MKMSKSKTNYFYTANGKLISCWYNDRRNTWTIGVQGTSIWYGYENKNEAIQKIYELTSMSVA